MSITGALSNAISGLNVASRSAELISSNLANALTEGYGRRTLAVSSQNVGVMGGVVAHGTQRWSDPALIADRRGADAMHAHADLAASFFQNLENLVGIPGEAGSLANRLTEMESALVSAASRPDSTQRLGDLQHRAGQLAGTINRISEGIQDARRAADQSIMSQVETLNDALARVQEMNVQIAGTTIRGGDASSLVDQRQRVVDSINSIVPVREIPRENGQVALFTPGGAILLDGPAARFEFSTTNMIMPHMTVDNGLVAGLSINGQSIDMSNDQGPLAGGTLGASFQVRDESGVVAQGQIDAVARSLVERFQSPAVDPTLAVTDPGLFTDAGAAFDVTDTVGLAGRMRLNDLVDPQQGGELWRLRDGLGAAAPGSVGDGTLLTAMGHALTTRNLQPPGPFEGGTYSASDIIAALSSDIGGARVRADSQLSFAAVHRSELQQQEHAAGVDSDVELQNLMLVEQSYAANARVIQVADEMMKTILGI